VAETPVPVPTLFTTYLTWSRVGLHVDFLGNRPAADRRSRGAAFWFSIVTFSIPADYSVTV
jgi:hypothetical protein